MSYNLYVWEQPAGQPQPATLEQASAMVRALESAGLRAGANMQSFVRNLPPELEAPADSPVLVLGVPGADRLRSVRNTVDAARACRLTVLDEQLGLVFLPTGAVLPEDQAPLWNTVVEQLDAMPRPLAKGEIERLLRKSVGELLAPHGFTPVSGSRFHVEFVRRLDGGAQRVRFWISGAGSELRCAASFTVTHDEATEIYNRFCGSSFPGGGEWSLLINVPELLGDPEDSEFPVGSTSQVQALAATVARVVLPRLDEWQTIADVDQIVNREVRFPVMTQRFAALIIAALAGNPDFDRLADGLRARKAKQSEEVRAVLERLITYLRQLRANPSSR